MMMDSEEPKPLTLSRQDLTEVCRLCLKRDDFMICIYDRIDPNPNKRPLVDRIYDLFQIKISTNDGLPTNICHSCLFYTENFSEFRENIRECETKLQNFIITLGFAEVTAQAATNKDKILPQISMREKLQIISDDVVMVVDPTKDYDSSGDNESAAVSEAENEPLEIENNNVEAPKKMIAYRSNTTEADGLKNVFFCQYCDTAYTDQLKCDEHEATHDLVNPYQCNFCTYKCENRNIVIGHIKDCHESEKPFICIQCYKKFGRRSDLKKHSVVHTGIRPFCCPVCSKNFSRNTNLTKHLRIHSGLKPHVCQQCPRSFTTRGDLFRHIQVHKELKPFQCAKCPATFSRKDKYIYHEKSHLKKEQWNFDSESIIVSLDPFPSMEHQTDEDRKQRTAAVTTNGEPPKHRTILFDEFENQQHKLQKQLQQKQLSIEQQPLQEQSIVQQHQLKQEDPDEEEAVVQQIQQSHQTEVDQQPKRQYFEFQQQEVQLHNQQPVALIEAVTAYPHVTGDAINMPAKKFKNLSCEVCQKKFASPSSLVNHRNIHLGIRNHVCEICQKSFIRKRELDRHSVIHTGYKPYSCSYCNKHFGRKDKLVRHERIHLDEKMFVCTQCNMQFNRKDGLSLHMKTHLRDENGSGLPMRSLSMMMMMPPPPPTTNKEPYQPQIATSFLEQFQPASMLSVTSDIILHSEVMKQNEMNIVKNEMLS